MSLNFIDLKNHVAIVTGSSKGIGFEIARQLGLAGAKVVLCARNEDELLIAKSQLEKQGIQVIAKPFDLTNKDSAADLIKIVIDKWGQIDILVNNVGGIKKTGDFFSLSDGDWLDAFDLNLLTMVRFSREAIPYLKNSKCGRIINLSSFVAKQPGKMNPHYSAMKAAILNLTKHLSNHLASTDVTVNAISPGNIATEGWAQHIAKKAKDEGCSIEEVSKGENGRASQSIPKGRLGTPCEVAALALFLCSPAASYITGVDYLADGGKRVSI